jgi:hypothetical protein
MNTRIPAAFALGMLAAALLLSSCSKKPVSVVGAWKNAEGSTIEFRPDSVALLGQEGYTNTVRAHWRTLGDTVRVTTDPEADEISSVTNEYVFTASADTLHMHHITLYRPGDTHTLTAADIAMRMGKPVWRLSFARMQPQAKKEK